MFAEHDYETVAGVNKKTSTATDYGYETVENIQHFERLDENRFDESRFEQNRFDEGRYSGSQQLRSMPSHVEMRRHAAPAAAPPPMTNHNPHTVAGRSVSLSPKLGGDHPEQISPSVRMSVRQVTAVPPRRPPRRSSVTVIELRSDDSRQSSPGFGDDDDTVNSGGEGTEVNTTIFV